MSTSIMVLFLMGALLVGIILLLVIVRACSPVGKLPKPQPPPHDISDRDRFNAARKNWENRP